MALAFMGASIFGKAIKRRTLVVPHRLGNGVGICVPG